MARYLCLNVWPAKSKINNGFAFPSLIIAVTSGMMLVMALIPAIAQEIQLYAYSQSRERIICQGNTLEEAMFTELRYGKNITVMDDEITFTSVSGRNAGYCIRNQILYKILDDGTKQPVTGNGKSMLPASDDIVMEQSHQEPFFAKRNKSIIVTLVLHDLKNDAKEKYLFVVTPLYEYWEG